MSTKKDMQDPRGTEYEKWKPSPMTPQPQQKPFLHKGKTHWECPMGYNCDTCPNFSGCQSIPPCASHSSRPAPSAPDPEQCPDTCIYKRFSKNMRNAEAREATIRNQTLDELSEWCNSTYVRNEIRDFKVYKSLRREGAP